MSVNFKEVFFETIDSTNLESTRRIKEGEMTSKSVVWAERQESGRGRTGRVWQSPEGNLYCSFCVPVSQSLAPNIIPFASALAIHDVLGVYMDESDHDRVGLKWPNDVLIDGAKCAGILIEKETDTNGQEWYVIGVGFNLVFAPQDVQGSVIQEATKGGDVTAPANDGVQPMSSATYNSATCLSYYTTFRPGRRDVLAELDKSMERWCANANLSSEEVFENWREHAYGLGKMIIVRLANGKTEPGVFEDIDNNGFLLLRKTGGDVHKIASADVFFAPVMGSGTNLL